MIQNTENSYNSIKFFKNSNTKSYLNFIYNNCMKINIRYLSIIWFKEIHALITIFTNFQWQENLRSKWNASIDAWN